MILFDKNKGLYNTGKLPEIHSIPSREVNLHKESSTCDCKPRIDKQPLFKLVFHRNKMIWKQLKLF